MSRTKHSFYNFLVSTIAALVLPLIGFVKVRLFVSLYGSAVNGLQLTIAQVITFLNICELAYSLAFRQLLYKPLAENDREEVKNIYHGAVKIFRLTGTVCLILSLITALIFPSLAVSPFSYWETVGTFLLLAMPYGISYFLFGPNFVIMADQKEYRINFWIQLISILRMVFMVIAILLKMPFVVILVIEALNILCANTLSRFIALREYPWLREEPQNKDDHSFQKKAGYAMIQRLSELATTQTDNIVISGFMGYVMSSVYGTYSYLTDNIGKITQTMVQSPMNSFGNLFNDRTADSYPVFTEFFNFATYVSTIVACTIVVVMPQFVPVWMNDPLYTASMSVCFFFGLNIFYMTMRQPVIIARDANGLYVNAKNNAWLLAVVKIVLSVILVQKLGLLGVVLATTIAYWAVDFSYNPVLVYRNVFHLPARDYYIMVASRLLLALGIGTAGYFFWNQFLASYAMSGRFALILSILILAAVITVVTTAIYWAAYRSFRHLYVRLAEIIRRRRNKNA
ncbi:MAG: hypothetical protein IKD68_06530 [Solobacterium sp.]|nr:hypothetical protein [Solobacterium sp.]